MSKCIDKRSFEGDIQSVRAHYRSIRSVIETMALLGDQYPTLGFAGSAGWYRTRDVDDTEQIESGYSKRARCTTFERDFQHIVNSQLGVEGRDRELFNITSWKDPDAATAWKHHTPPPNREWNDDSGGHPPGYEALRGFGFWVDLDLEHKDGRAALTNDELATVEQVQQRVIDVVADAYNVDNAAIYGLDSGGGAYVYGPPEATLPITEYLDDPQEREWFFDDLADRINDGPLADEIESIIDEEGAEDLLDPDWCQNKNRQSKAPGSLHHSHDIVVMPLRDRHPYTGDLTGRVNYTPTRISEFTREDIKSLEAWADGLTTIEHTDAVGPFLKTLYPDHTDAAEDWRDIVDAVVQQRRDAFESQQQRRTERRDTIREWTAKEGSGDSDRSDIDADVDADATATATTTTTGAGSLTAPDGMYSGAEIVTERSELDAAIESIDITDVVRTHASDAYDTSNRSHEVTFDPSWRHSESGQSCAIPNGKNIFVDNGCNGAGGPVRAYALGEGILSNGSDDEKAAAQSISGQQFGETVQRMRADGYKIPVYVPEAGDEYEHTPLWALRKAALTLGVIDSRDDFKHHETDDGDTDTYLGFDAATYNAVLDALDDEDIEHGRERLDTRTDTEPVYQTPDKFIDTTNNHMNDDTSPAATTPTPTPTPTRPANDLIEWRGCYGYETTDAHTEETEWHEATNFLLETIECISTSDGLEFRLRVHPARSCESAYEVTVEPTVFNQRQTFCNEVVTGRTTTLSDTSALNDLRETVGAQAAPERTGVAHVGPASADLDEWVTPNGVLTADGWTDTSEHKYYAQASSDSGDTSIVGEKWMLSPADGDSYDSEAVRTVLELLPQSRLPAQSVAILGWFYSVPAKPLIHDCENEFNHLHVRGKTETGKTSCLQLFTEAFGMTPNPSCAGATTFSLEQLHAGSRGAPVWIDEYKPSDMNQETADALHRYLRIATREGTQTKGRPDQSFTSFKLQSPICLSGEQQVNEPAVRRRMLQVRLSDQATTNLKHIAAYSELAGESYNDADGNIQTPSDVDLSQHALAYYRFLLGCDSDELEELWDDSREDTCEILDTLGMQLQDSEFQAAQTIVFGYELYRQFADELSLSPDRLPGDDAVQAAIERFCNNVGANGCRREHSDEFLELLSQATRNGYIDGLESGSNNDDDTSGSNDDDGIFGYRVYDPDVMTPDDVLAVHLPTVYPEVKKYARKYNVEDEYNLLTKQDYTDEFADLAETDGSHVVRTSHSVRFEDDGRKRCVIFDPYEVHARLGADFDLSTFGLETPDTSEHS